MIKVIEKPIKYFYCKDNKQTKKSIIINLLYLFISNTI